MTHIVVPIPFSRLPGAGKLASSTLKESDTDCATLESTRSMIDETAACNSASIKRYGKRYCMSAVRT